MTSKTTQNASKRNMKATASIPLFARLTLTLVEPLMSLNGVLICIRNPQRLIGDYLTRGAVSYTPETQTLYTQLAGFWLFFAFVEVFVLRSFDDQRLWKRLCIGMLISDAVYFWAVAQAVGGWDEFLNVGVWSADEWTVTLGALWPVSVRLFIVFGL